VASSQAGLWLIDFMASPHSSAVGIVNKYHTFFEPVIFPDSLESTNILEVRKVGHFETSSIESA
jgi:hypothetical protein